MKVMRPEPDCNQAWTRNILNTSAKTRIYTSYFATNMPPNKETNKSYANPLLLSTQDISISLRSRV